MGADLHGAGAPTQPEYRVVTGRDYTALYRRQTDRIYGDDEVDNWHLLYVTNDTDMIAWSAMETVLSRTATERFAALVRDDLCQPGSDETFPATLPRDELEKMLTPLERRAKELSRELARLNERIRNGETE